MLATGDDPPGTPRSARARKPALDTARLPGQASATRGTYWPAPYRLAGPVHGEPGQRATPFAGAKPMPPYSSAERTELAAIAAFMSADPPSRY